MRAWIALLTIAVVTAPFTVPAAAQTCSNQSYNPATKWVSIKGPKFSKGAQEITSHAVDPANPRVIYVTNGTVVAVTTDTGCAWTETYTGPSGPGAPTSYVIQQIHVPSPHTVLLRIHETAPLSRPRIEVSTSGGQNWQTGGAGLAAGEPEFLRSAEKSPTPLYLGVDVGGGALDMIYASEDSGDTWVLRTDPSKSEVLAGINDIEVDAVDPQVVFGFGTGGLFLSQNGAQSFSEVPEFSDAGRVGPVDVFHNVGSAPYIMAFRPDEDRLGISRTGEEWLYGNQIPDGIDTADHGNSAGDVIVSANSGVHRYHVDSQGWPEMDAPSGARGVIATHAPSLMLTARGGSSIYRWIEPLGGDGTGGFLDEDRNISLVQPPEVVAKESSIFPDGKKIVIPVGDSKKIRYTVKLPERPRPLDVFFLVDTSSSMTRTIDGLAYGLQDIVNELAKEGIDVNFGLAEYRTYPTSNPPKSTRPGEKEDSFVYKMKVDIQEGVQALAGAINELEADGGGHYDAHLGALKQAATGEGQDLFPVGVSNAEDVPPGQQASFREKAIRVVINATDEQFGESEGGAAGVLPGADSPDPRQAPPPEIPSFEEVIGLLNEKAIKQVGLSIGYLPYKDLTRVARETKTVAFGEGVDCNGDGSIEIRISEPLVCKLRSETTSDSAINLVPAVVNLLRSVQDPVPVQLEAVKGEEVVEKIGPDGYESVILQSMNSLTFDVTFACSKRQGGDRFPVTLQADSTVDLSKLSVDALVVCKGTDPADEVLPVGTLAAPLIALAVPPPPPIPPSVAELSSATQTQAQSQAQAQGAAAQQEQQEPQLAYVAASGLEDEETLELNMTAYSDRREVPAPALLAMGVVALSMMFGAGVVAQRTQQRTRAQRQGR